MRDVCIDFLDSRLVCILGVPGYFDYCGCTMLPSLQVPLSLIVFRDVCAVLKAAHIHLKAVLWMIHCPFSKEVGMMHSGSRGRNSVRKGSLAERAA